MMVNSSSWRMRGSRNRAECGGKNSGGGGGDGSVNTDGERD
mgnify:CR=1 FL=1